MRNILNIALSKCRNTGRGFAKSTARAVCILLLLLPTVYGQEITYNTDGSVNLKFANVLQWEQYKKQVLYMSYERAEYDSLIKVVYKPEINKQFELLLFKDSLINLQKESIKKDKELIEHLNKKLTEQSYQPDIVFDGFYAGFSTAYMFADSITDRNTLLKNLADNICLTSKVVVKAGKFMLNPVLEVPLADGKKINLKVDFSYKLF